VSELDQKILDKIQELIQLCEQAKQTRYSKSTGNMVVIGDAGVDSGLAHQWGTSCLNLLRRVFGQDSVDYENFQAKFPRFQNYSPVTQALGVLRAAKDDYEQGFLFDTRTLIEVEVFDDFLEQGEHLFGAGYYQPAAVVAAFLRTVYGSSVRGKRCHYP